MNEKENTTISWDMLEGKVNLAIPEGKNIGRIMPLNIEPKIPTAGTFHKVSFDEFCRAWNDLYKITDKDLLSSFYDNIMLPKHSTKDSAGYDFFPYFDFKIYKGTSMVIPTGIKCALGRGFSLDLYPRSGDGFKFKMEIANTIGIIDKDFFNNPKNEGHIMVKLTYVGIEEETSISYHKHNLDDGTEETYLDFSKCAILPSPVNEVVEFKANKKAYAQGIIHQYFNVTNEESESDAERTGGLGSTTKKE